MKNSECPILISASGANRREYTDSYLNARSEAIARGILERKARVAVWKEAP
jgi:hypothetical protein